MSVLGTMALASLGSSALGSLTSLFSNKSNQASSMKMLNAQNAFTEDMWNKTNEYNKTSNVLQRYLDAGITPGAAVQAATGVQGLASSVQSSSQQAPQMDLGKDVIGSFNSLTSALTQQAQIDNLNEDTRTKEIENTYKAQEIQKNLEKITKDISGIEQNIAESNKRIESLNADIDRMKSQKENTDAQTRLLIQDYNKNIELNEQLILKAKEEVLTQKALTGKTLTEQETLRIHANAAMKQAKAAVAVAKAEAYKLISEGKISQAHANKAIEEYEALMAQNWEEVKLKKFEAQCKKWEAENPILSRSIGAIGSVTSTLVGVGAGVAASKFTGRGRSGTISGFRSY